MSRRKSNNPDGRPIQGREPKVRREIRIEPWRIARLTELGGGNFTRGVELADDMAAEKPPAAKRA